ncbi:MAG: hypothetical protein OXD50_11260 [Chloroflexi bacterium]|nr:hypothetical protein [Chloroflexota bacterium]
MHHLKQDARHDFGGGVEASEEIELALRNHPERGYKHLVSVVQQECVIPVSVDPALQWLFDVAEIYGKAKVVQFIAADKDLGAVCVAVWGGALAVVSKKAVCCIE